MNDSPERAIAPQPETSTAPPSETGQPVRPEQRRTLSGKLIPNTPRVDPEMPERLPSRHAYERASGRLTPEELTEFLNGDNSRFDELARDEMTRAPLNTRTQKRVVAKVMARKAKRGRVLAARSTIRLRLATPAPSRGFMRRLLANANRHAEQTAAENPLGIAA